LYQNKNSFLNQRKKNIMLSRIKILVAFILVSGSYFGQIPVLNSYPSITSKVIYLDFDGQVVSGTLWNSGTTVNALPSTMNSANIILIWKRISEDYRPFDVNITTDSVRFNNAPPNKRIRVVVTPTSAWYGSAGGVAYVGSFNWGGTPGTPCWVFENQLGYSTKNIAEAAAHEVGHTMTLRHQSIYSAITCSKTAEYNPGVGTGMTSWAPIMGVGYSKNVTIWHTGQSATSCTLIQRDHGNTSPGITSPNFLSFLTDDVGNTFGSAKILNLNTISYVDSGLISEPTDIDAFRFSICNNRYVSINVKPWALDTVNYQGANLDVRLALYNASNNLLAIDTPLTKLNSLVGLNLTSGTYYFTVDGGRSANYTDYGSLGKYYISIKATNPPVIVNTIVTNSNICAGQNTTLSYTSNGVPSTWGWTITGQTATTSTQQYPSLSFNAGLHTITLMALNSSFPSCPTTVTINVSTPPAMALTNTNNILCPGKTMTLSVSGASSYTWVPGNFSGATQIVTPTVTATYTIRGSNGTCNNSLVTTVTVVPNFTVSSIASETLVCEGESITLTNSGASAYTITPGNITSNPATLSPFFPTIYVVTGQNGPCSKAVAVSISVTPHYAIYLTKSDSAICAGSSATLTATGAVNYTFNPGGLTGYTAVVSPTTTTNYTVTSSGNGACIEDTTITVAVKLCDFTGITSTSKESGIHIYPNPSQGSVVIETEITAHKIEIINSIGQVVFTGNLNGKTTRLITSDWTPGVYFVKLSADGKDFYTEKLIVE